MALDKSVVKRIATQTGVATEPMSGLWVAQLTDFAQAIYALGVKDERERAAKVCESLDNPYGSIAGMREAMDCAEAIRKGE